jgi:protein-L-isoaspartate(D-aspartate) O-methyltransferase
MVRGIEAELGPFAEAHLAAVREVPRETFVRPEDREQAELDMPLPLDDNHAATISAPHAYLLSYRLLDLQPGDRLLELGSGSGYGAALASEIVGPSGRVVTIEIDGVLAERARGLLADRANVRCLRGDARDAGPLVAESNKIVCAFALPDLPRDWTRALQPGATLVAPVGGAHRQELVRVTCDAHHDLTTTRHGAVRYVPDRSE